MAEDAIAVPQAPPALELVDVFRRYPAPGSRPWNRRWVPAVRGVSLSVARGETLGLVGESGCGKSTLARVAMGLERPDAGQVLIDGVAVATLGRLARARLVQPVFQDPYSSLNPRHAIAAIIGAPLRIHGVGDASERASAVREIMDMVGLPARVADQRPHQLSGGQRQRVAIARALVLRPALVICDEPTSSLDVSVQAQILNLLLELQKELRLTYLLISHNLAVIDHMSDRIAVMYLGRIVEEAPGDALFGSASHPYTRALVGSLLSPDPGAGLPSAMAAGQGPPDPSRAPEGCAFHPRCPQARPECASVVPRPVLTSGRRIECHLYPAAVPGAQ